MLRREELSHEEQLTIATYDRNVTDWRENNYHGELWGEDFGRFRHYLLRGRVLDIGAGSGTDTGRFIATGYDYVGTDASAAQVAEARRLYPGLDFLQRSVYDLQFPENSFDGFWAAAVLIHLPRARVGEALNQIHRVVRPGGIGFISLKEGMGQAVTSEPAEGTTYERLFTYYKADEFQQILETHQFDTLSVTSRQLRPDLTWLKFLVQCRE